MAGAKCAGVVELEDAPDSKSSSARGVGSISTARTIDVTTAFQAKENMMGSFLENGATPSIHDRRSIDDLDLSMGAAHDQMAKHFQVVLQDDRVEAVC